MAYVVIVSLKQTVERLLSSSNPRIPIPDLELKHILENLRYLKSFFDKISSLQDNDSFDKLEKEIKDILQNIQDLIDSYISDRIHSGSESSDPEFSEKLQKVNEQLSSSTKTMLETKGEYYNTEGQQPKNDFATDPGSPIVNNDGGENEMIGMDHEVMKLKQRLLRESRSKIIPIVGMAGIGKTAIAIQVLRDPIIIKTFPLRLFVPVGQQYRLRNCLVNFLREAGVGVEKFMGKRTEELGEFIYQYLENKRYLVVLDDIWDSVAWNELEQFLPDDNDDSRIIWTARMPDVIKRAGIGESAFEIGFLTASASWDLLCKTVFPKSQCPYYLEKAGKKIAKNCEGLPLAIKEVGKHLLEQNKTVEYWTEAAEGANSDIRNFISKFLSPTYKSLPQHLKPCFLYMGVFPKNYNIPSSHLIRLWIAEEFIDRYSCVSIEQRAEEYLEDLVSRGLVIVHERSSRGIVKTCRIHSVYRNLCINEAQNENLFYIINQFSFHIIDQNDRDFPQGKIGQRRLCIHNGFLLRLKIFRELIESCSLARSLLCFDPQHQHQLRSSTDLPSLLRVLHAHGISFSKLSNEVAKLVQLRYLAFSCDGELPASISSLGDLEFLIVNQNRRINPLRTPVYLPVQIWELRKLRYLECMGFDLLDPSTASIVDEHGSGDTRILEKLLTLSGVSAHSCTQGVLSRIPNLSKLRIWYEPMCHGFLSFSVFGNNLLHLESFKCISGNLGFGSPVISSTLYFHHSLRKVTLRGCGFPWEHIKVIAALKNLEVLKLQWYAFRGPKWEAQEGGFPRLKLLLLEDSDIKYWESHSLQFSQLSTLIIRHCYQLEELPPELGEILTLERIELVGCNPSAMASATKICEVQQEFGNHDLQLKLDSAFLRRHSRRAEQKSHSP